MATRSDLIVTGIFRDRTSAERAYECVKSRGYTDNDVSVLMSNDTRARCFPRSEVAATELGSKAGEGAGVGFVAGGGLGALLMGLAAAGIAVPGLPIIAMGPLAAAFAGGAGGGVVGAIVGAFVGSGIPEERAKLYETGIGEGGIVLGVTPRSDADAEFLERCWADAGGEQIYRPGVIAAGRRI